MFFFKIDFKKLFQEYHQCQAGWIQIRSYVLSGLTWVQTVCTGYEQMRLAGKGLDHGFYVGV